MNKIIFLEKTDTAATLTTWIYCAMWQMWSAEQMGLKDVYINWFNGASTSRCLQAYNDKDKFLEMPNQFEWYFNQPKTIIWKYSLMDVRGISEIWTWENWKDECSIPFMSQPLSIIKHYYKKNLIFNDETNKRGQLLVDKYGIDFSKTIGLTWRGTDIYLDGRPRVPIEVYFPFIDEILEKEPDLRIACTAEEMTILESLFKRYPNAFNIDEFISVPFQTRHNPERFSERSGYENGLQPALIVWLFSKCKYYIKNRSSTGAVASWLSEGKIINIFHPETLGFPANTNTIEIEGKQYTTENKLIEQLYPLNV